MYSRAASSQFAVRTRALCSSPSATIPDHWFSFAPFRFTATLAGSPRCIQRRQAGDYVLHLLLLCLVSISPVGQHLLDLVDVQNRRRSRECCRPKERKDQSTGASLGGPQRSLSRVRQDRSKNARRDRAVWNLGRDWGLRLQGARMRQEQGSSQPGAKAAGQILRKALTRWLNSRWGSPDQLPGLRM